MDSTEQILAALPEITGWHEDFYRDLHQHPELSFQETRTASRVAERLRELGFEVHEKIGGTGLVGILRNGGGKTVLARADMDALPVLEESGLPYASVAATVDAEGKTVPLMHACGHDLHVTCLLAAAQLLAGRREAWAGTFIALFQPAEEVGAGARSMVDGGLEQLIPRPDVALGQHVMGLPFDTVATRPGAIMSAADSVRVTV
ncbi:MAG TPA: M20/M25/M40 family metallo-hydrolase, partial [Micrococcaceae bacterium]